ncbi:MAG: hypothetical protein AMXMBFR84_17160 [Candidatus Hydrogenedentota bacterium]
MKRFGFFHTAWFIAVLNIGLGGSQALGQEQTPPPPPPETVSEIPVHEMVPADQIEKVKMAIPTEARVQPKQPRKLLVFTKTAGFRHKSIEIGSYSIKTMGEQTGAYSAYITDNPNAFKKDFLDQFDGVLMLNTTMTLFEDKVLQQNLLDFVAAGKGIAGIHAATDCFYDWASYGDMMGGYFDGHPWGAGDTVTVRIDDPGHPLVEVFHNRDYVVIDEIYQLKEPYSRDKLRILLTLNTDKTDMTKKGIKRTDGDFAVSWVRAYDKGRVYYCSLGHNEHIYWDPTITRYYLDGLQFALGDLEADTMPSAQLPPEYFEKARSEAQLRAVESLVDAVASWDIGKPEADVVALRDTVSEYAKNEPVRAKLEDNIAEILGSDASFAAKDVAAKELFRIGTAASVPSLAKLLHDDTLSDVARYGLERNPSPEATTALIEALPKCAGLARAGIINSLGERRDPAAVKALIHYLDAKPDEVAGAAMAALSKIGGSDALRALKAALTNTPDELKQQAHEALLAIANRFAEDGNQAVAQKLFEDYFTSSLDSTPAHIRIAAFEGLMRVNPAQAEEWVPKLLTAQDPEMRRLGGAALAALPGDISQYATLLSGLQPDAQASVIRALGDHGTPNVFSNFVEMTKSEDVELRLTSIEALGKIGDGSVVPLLAECAASEDRPTAEAARASLDRLNADGVEEAMAAQLTQGTPLARVELAQSLARRNSTTAVPALLGAAKNGDPATSAAVFEALSTLAKPEHVPALVELLATATAANAREAAGHAIVAAANRNSNATVRAEPVAAALAREDLLPEARIAFLTSLSGIGTDQALVPVRSALECTDANVKVAAVRSMAAWPTPAPLSCLETVARSDSSDELKRTALRGYIELLKRPSDRSAEESAALYKLALDLASSPDDIKLALSGLKEVRHPSVIEIVKPYLANEAVKAEAELVADALNNVTMAVTASANAGEAGNAIDHDPNTRWSTSESQRDGQWFQVDLGWERRVRCIRLDTTGSNGDYPRKYEVYVSNSAEGGTTPAAAGDGGGPITEISFEPRNGRFVRIVQKGSDGLWWSIHELTVDCEA